jgi:hypothetical protein
MMITRRDAVASFALLAELVASSHLAEAQQTAPASPPTAPRPPVFKHDLPNVTMDGWEVTVSYVDYPPGRVGTVHHHAGFVLAYVLEGASSPRSRGRGRKRPTRPGRCSTSSPVPRTKFEEREPDAAGEAASR